MSILTTWLVAH